MGTYLVAIELLPQKVVVGDKTYELALRFQRNYKPYSMKLHDVRFDKYMGTQTAKNYSSDLRLVDPTRDVDRDVKIWMNNPLRFAGETFYQSSYDVDERGQEATTLQVVDNTGWMIPYVACMLVATGMLAQFSITLVRFLKRREDSRRQGIEGSLREKISAPLPNRRTFSQPAPPPAAPKRSLADLAVPIGVVVLAALWVLSSARQPHIPTDQIQLDEFGRLPLVYEGRVKPFDTLARNMLRQISDKQTFTDETGKEPKRSQPAMKWLMDVITRDEKAFKHKVFRITNLDVLQTLGLTRRQGFLYSVEEFQDKIGEFERQAALAAKAEKDNPASLTIYQKKMLELDKKIRLLTLLMASFEQPQIRHDHVQEDLTAAIRGHQQLAQMQPPLAVPPESAEAQWEPYSVAYTKAFAKANILDQKPNPATLALNGMFSAYHKGDAKQFNAELADYENLVGRAQVVGLRAVKDQLRSVFQLLRAVLSCQRVVPGCLRVGGAGLAGLDAATEPRRVLAGGVYFRAAYVRPSRADLYLRPAARHESVFVGRVHRLGSRGCWASPWSWCIGSALAP